MTRSFVIGLLGAALLLGCRVSATGLTDADVQEPAGGVGGTLAGGASGAPATCPVAIDTTKASGQSCTCAGECASGFCTDGVCCEEACDGPCRTCASAAAKGRCKLAGSGENDPHSLCVAKDACGPTGKCDGQGQCAKPPKETACGDTASCEGNSYRAAGGSCDGLGMCTRSSLKDCTPYLCTSSGCKDRCESDNDCVAGKPCVEGKCGNPRDNGATCSDNSGCDSGFCVKGICCEKDCSGECRSCGLTGSRGICKFIPAGNKPDEGECAGDRGPCRRTGLCNGEGQCALEAAGTLCGMASCESNMERAAPQCDGAGTCITPAGKTCYPHICGGASTCLASCTNDAGCSGGAICQKNRCGDYPILEIPRGTGAPDMKNGKWDVAVWEKASPFQNVANYVVGTPVNNNSVQFRAYWTLEALHVLVLVEDAMLFNQGSLVHDDTIEIYVDADGSRGTQRDGLNDFHLLFGWNEKKPFVAGLGIGDDSRFFLHDQFTTPNGYGMEFSLHWGSLNTTASLGKTFGLDINVVDDDDGGDRERQVAWTNTLDTNYRDPSAYGRVRLVAPR